MWQSGLREREGLKHHLVSLRVVKSKTSMTGRRSREGCLERAPPWVFHQWCGLFADYGRQMCALIQKEKGPTRLGVAKCRWELPSSLLAWTHALSQSSESMMSAHGTGGGFKPVRYGSLARHIKLTLCWVRPSEPFGMLLDRGLSHGREVGGRLCERRGCTVKRESPELMPAELRDVPDKAVPVKAVPRVPLMTRKSFAAGRESATL